MHAQDFQEPKGDTIWTKHQESQERTQKVWHQRIVQIISKNQINTKIDSKVQQVNKAKEMSIKDKLNTHAQDLSHSKKVKQKTRNEITNSPKEQGSNK